MWIFSTVGMFSVVIDAHHPGFMMIRARCGVDAANLWKQFHDELASMTEPTSSEVRDYRWRLSLSKDDWIKLAARLAEAIDYGNFKVAVHDRKDQANKTLAYSRVWQVLHDVQVAENRGNGDANWQQGR
jgi:hypothetical protein